MAQLNVSFDDALLAEVDRLAAQRGINRPELLRALVREAIGAEGKVGGAVVVPPPVAPEPLLLTTPQFLRLLGLLALSFLVVMLGMFALVIGILIALPIVVGAIAYAYEDLVTAAE